MVINMNTGTKGVGHSTKRLRYAEPSAKYVNETNIELPTEPDVWWIVNGNLEFNPTSGTMYYIDSDKDVFIIHTWQGSRNSTTIWEDTEDGIDMFLLISDRGAVVRWTHRESLRRLVPRSHYKLAERIADRIGKEFAF